LVQAAHYKTENRWIERGECVSEDLFFTFWRKLTGKGTFVQTKKVTCEWTNHPYQRHKITGEKFGGGLNKYRRYYDVGEPICRDPPIIKPLMKKKNTSYIAVASKHVKIHLKYCWLEIWHTIPNEFTHSKRLDIDSMVYGLSRHSVILLLGSCLLVI
jgi:hypothetical protein